MVTNERAQALLQLAYEKLMPNNPLMAHRFVRRMLTPEQIRNNQDICNIISWHAKRDQRNRKNGLWQNK